MSKTPRQILVTGLTLAIAGALTATRAEAFEQAQPNTQGTAAAAAAAASSPHAQTLAQGWAALGNGDYANAARLALQVLRTDPRSVPALALAVEADIVGAGAAGGLSAYEQWLGNRRIEEAYVLRKVATAFLR